METILIAVLAVVGFGLLVRLAAGGLDHDRVRRYVEERGGQVLESMWSPFGPGWFSESKDRIYGVRYVDADGNEHEAYCKTSLWGGVYFTEDRIVRPARQSGPEQESLEAENRRLRQELEQLKRERDQMA